MEASIANAAHVTFGKWQLLGSASRRSLREATGAFTFNRPLPRQPTTHGAFWDLMSATLAPAYFATVDTTRGTPIFAGSGVHALTSTI